MNRSKFLKYLGLSGLAGPVGSLFSGNYFLQEDIIKPPRLSEGGTIGLISPASILPDRERYDEITQTIRDLGFNVKLGRHARHRNGYLAGSDKQRAADLNAMFADPEIDAIIPFRGGWGSNRILQLIDFDLIRSNPKPLIGFSDITSLLLSIYAKTGLVTFHGPVGKSEWNDFTIRNFRRAVMDGTPFTLQNPQHQKIRTIRSGVAQGPLMGGNLTVLTSMIGSGYLPDFTGAILFLEDVGENVYRIDRMLTQLELTGILESINGVVFGQCVDCLPGNDYSFTLEEVINEKIAPLAIPAFYGAMIGHIEQIFTLPIGLPTSINADKGSITFPEPAVQ